MNQRIRLWIHSIVAPHGKQAFVRKIRHNGKVLDLGCGNNSPMLVKKARPDIEYWGIDVADYNNGQGKQYADRYILVEPDGFADAIKELPVKFDAIISSHNIEHCNKPKETIEAFLGKLTNEGMLYFAFPSEKSVEFPKRQGTLNFYDDMSHIYMPEYKDILKILRKNGIDICFARKKYKPFLLAVVGGCLEPLSKRKQKVFPGTWAYWGFETKIWGKKII